MKTIGVFEAKTHLSEIINSGEEVCLTNRGKQVAVIVPFSKYNQSKNIEVFAKLQKLKINSPLGNHESILEMKNEGLK